MEYPPGLGSQSEQSSAFYMGLVPTCRRRLKIMQCVSFFCTTLRWVLNSLEMGRYPKFINEWVSWEECVAICDCPHRERRTGRSGGDTDLWERYWLLHLCTCLFIVTAAGTQNPAGGCQRADGLQMIFQQSKLTNDMHINKSKETATNWEAKSVSV